MHTFYTIESIFSFTIDNTWTLDSTKNEKASISLKSKVSPAKKEFEINGVKLKHNVAGSQEGTYIFDLKNKHLLSSTVTQTLAGAMKLNRMNVPINIQSKIIQTISRQK